MEAHTTLVVLMNIDIKCRDMLESSKHAFLRLDIAFRRSFPSLAAFTIVLQLTSICLLFKIQRQLSWLETLRAVEWSCLFCVFYAIKGSRCLLVLSSSAHGLT
jgi:hypothetical protein